mgnify:CR=1 FL=1
MKCRVVCLCTMLLAGAVAVSALPAAFVARAGHHFGGIIDNSSVDAVSGATQWGYRAGVGAQVAIGRHHVEAGLEYLHFAQSISYADATEGFDGSYDLSYNEMRIPLSYNLNLLENSDGKPLGVVRTGPCLGFVFGEQSDSSGTVPAYETGGAEMGVLLSGTLYPLRRPGGFSFGVCCDFYRGFTSFFRDPYHEKNHFEHGRLSTLGLGLVVRFDPASAGP